MPIVTKFSIFYRLLIDEFWIIVCYALSWLLIWKGMTYWHMPYFQNKFEEVGCIDVGLCWFFSRGSNLCSKHVFEFQDHSASLTDIITFCLAVTADFSCLNIFSCYGSQYIEFQRMHEILKADSFCERWSLI